MKRFLKILTFSSGSGTVVVHKCKNILIHKNCTDQELNKQISSKASKLTYEKWVSEKLYNSLSKNN
jgi:hypothetical protein